MKVAYNKISDFSIFGIKIFEFKTKYYEHSIDEDDDDDRESITLTQRIIEGR